MPKKRPDPNPIEVMHHVPDVGKSLFDAMELGRRGRRVTVEIPGEPVFTTDERFVTPRDAS